MDFSRTNLSQPSRVSHDPMFAAASLTDSFNITALAKLIGKSEKTLAAKLNNDPEYDHHNLHLAEAVAITEITGDERILSAWANSRGKVLVSLPKTGLTDDEFSDVLLTVQTTQGELASAIKKARADGVITEADYAAINRNTLNAIQQLLQLDAELKAQVREFGGNE